MAEAKYQIRRKCECCGATFLAKSLESRFCSKSCSNKACKQRQKEKQQADRWNTSALISNTCEIIACGYLLNVLIIVSRKLRYISLEVGHIIL